ncbi:MAG: tetratricopeptide repeat protein [Candidatus Heimdallarchaeota archaeon]|nr:tetratricopeptide repeat protein [Candidatus Heimdallarchaeota archaeon]MBY8994398.1 tetratricopeptide repeat protein [Candidatus Heimdallarchaeota archaeon]
MRIRERIMVTFIVLLIVPPVIMITVSSVRISRVSRDNTNDSSDALLTEELAHLQRLSSDESQKINELLDQIVAEVTMLDSYAEDLFNDKIPITPYQSYWWDKDLEFVQTGRNIPGIGYDADYDSDISFDASCYYLPRTYITNNLSGDPFNWDPTLQTLLDTSSNLDIAFENMHEANPNYVWIYMAFTDASYSLFRNYPYDSMLWTQDLDEDDIIDPPEDDWDPRGEDFYTIPAAISNTSDTTAFIAPYFDPVGLLISAGRPVYFDNGTLVGIVSVDITVATMQDSILNLEVSENGYAFLIDSDGSTITHPGLVDDFVPIQNLEMADTPISEQSAFQLIIDDMKGGGNDQQSFTKNGEKWYISYDTIDASGYSLALMVPEADILAPVIQLRDDIMGRSTNNILISVGLLVLALILIIFISVSVSRATVEPIQDFIDFSKRVGSGDLSRDLDEDVAIPREIMGLHEALDGLLTALRFGNTDYYEGNLDLAFNNYLKALKLFETTKDQVGIGVCLNNIGNVYREWGDLPQARDFYAKAIGIAENLDDKVGLASRYNNYGLVLLDSGELDEAQKYIERALKLNEEINNTRGRVLCLNNLGLIHFKLGSVKLAFGYYQDAMKLAKDEDFVRGLAHSLLNLAMFYLEQYDVHSAKTHMNEALESARTVNDVLLEEEILERLKLVERDLGDDASQAEIRQALEVIRGTATTQKSVLYVLDYSGSMSGSRNRASVRGSLDLFNTAIKEKDTVGVITFHTTSRMILQPTPVRNNKTKIQETLKRLTRPNGNTALWDAVADAIDSLESIGGTQRWLVLLTDGEDNSSRRTANEINKKITKLKSALNLVVISVGDIGTDEAILMEFCDRTNGTFIKITDTKSVHKEIEKAFKTVGQLMSQAQVSVEGLVLDDM